MPAQRTIHGPLPHMHSSFIPSLSASLSARTKQPLTDTDMALAFRVTLLSSDRHDGLPERQLSLVPYEPFTIGRASTNSMKPNLMMAADNAFIDSPVISRSHASLTLRLCPPAIHITDNDSMHGTMVNGTRLHPRTPTRLNDGDLLQFGLDVTRNDRKLPSLTFCLQADALALEYFVARKYTFHAPSFDTLEPESSSSRATTLTAFNNVFTVPDSDDDEDQPVDLHKEVDIKDRDTTNEWPPSEPLRSRLGSQANPVPIDDADEFVPPRMTQMPDSDNQGPAVLDRPMNLAAIATSSVGALLDHSDEFDEDPSVDPHYEGSVCSSDAEDVDGFSCFSSGPESDMDIASDMDARTDFEVSDDEGHEAGEEEDDYELNDVDEEDDHGIDDDEKNNENMDSTCRMKMEAMLNQEPQDLPPIPAVDPALAPDAQAAPHLEGLFAPNIEAQVPQAMPRVTSAAESPSNTYKMGPFVANHGNYTFGCVDSTLPYGGESSKVGHPGPFEYVSPYMPRETGPFVAAPFDLPTSNAGLPHAERYAFEPYVYTCFPPTPPKRREPAAIPSAVPVPALSAQVPMDHDSSFQPARRTKVSIPEIVEEAPAQQPLTPTSVSGSLKRKADDMEEEDTPEAVAEPLPSSSPTSSDLESAPLPEASAPPSPPPSIQERPRKRLRTALGTVAKMSAYLIPSTAIAVGMLTQLPDAFFQG